MTKIVRIGDITGFDDAEIIELEEENSDKEEENDYKQDKV